MIELPRVIGHRGAAAHAPENTVGGLARAAELGCTWVEVDVQLTRDGVPVLLHDANLQRTTGLDKLVREAHSREVAELDAGSWFGPEWSDERVPTLAQALDACRVLGLTPNLEIKADSGRRRATARAIAQTVAERWPGKGQMPLVSSFSLRALYHARMAAPWLPLGLLMGRRPRRLWTLHARLLRCVSVHVDPELAATRLVERAGKRGLAVAVYTVNEPGEAAKLFERGVASVFSDSPDLILDAADA